MIRTSSTSLCAPVDPSRWPWRPPAQTALHSLHGRCRPSASPSPLSFTPPSLSSSTSAQSWHEPCAGASRHRANQRHHHAADKQRAAATAAQARGHKDNRRGDQYARIKARWSTGTITIHPPSASRSCFSAHTAAAVAASAGSSTLQARPRRRRGLLFLLQRSSWVQQWPFAALAIAQSPF